jgi:DNA-binding response OmpR family regulator
MLNTPTNNPITLKVLLLEDNNSLAEEMVAFLSANGMMVCHCSSILQLDSKLTQDKYQLLILDRMLPEGDSLDHIEAIKALHSGYIIMLSALGMSSDRISGLNAGADYYLAKPVDLNELLAVSRSVMRKTDHSTIRSDWQLSEEKKTVKTPSGIEVSLTGSEFNLLKTLMQQPNAVFKREAIVESLGFELEHYDVRRLDTLVCRLRGKIRGASDEDIPIHTFSKVGYAWKSNQLEHNESH